MTTLEWPGLAAAAAAPNGISNTETAREGASIALTSTPPVAAVALPSAPCAVEGAGAPRAWKDHAGDGREVVVGPLAAGPEVQRDSGCQDEARRDARDDGGSVRRGAAAVGAPAGRRPLHGRSASRLDRAES